MMAEETGFGRGLSATAARQASRTPLLIPIICPASTNLLLSPPTKTTIPAPALNPLPLPSQYRYGKR